MPREAVDLAVGAVGHVDPFRSRWDGDAVAGPELAWPGSATAKREIEPRRLQGKVARHPRREDGVEARVSGGDVEKAVEELDVGGDEGTAPGEVVAYRGQPELVVRRGRGQRVEELAGQRGGEDPPLVVGGEAQERRSVGRVPDLRVVEVCVLHLGRGGHERDLLEVGAHPEDARAGQREVRLFLACPVIDGEAAVGGDEDASRLLRKAGGSQ